MMDSARRTAKTLHVVAGFYVAVGLAVAATAAFAGDRLSTFLGFLIISAALGGAVALGAVLRLGARIEGIGDTVEEIRVRIAGLERRQAAIPPANVPESAEEQEDQLVDLAAMGAGDPSALTAATLDRDVYPRLVTVLEQFPPAQSDALTDALRAPSWSAPTTTAEDDFSSRVVEQAASSNVTTRNLLREWKVALRDGDLGVCRTIFSALVDTASMTIVGPLSMELQELTARTEAALRVEFAACVRSRDYEGALDIGQRIVELLPDHPLVEEFNKLKPHLQHRAHRENPRSTPSLFLVH